MTPRAWSAVHETGHLLIAALVGIGRGTSRLEPFPHTDSEVRNPDRVLLAVAGYAAVEVITAERMGLAWSPWLAETLAEKIAGQRLADGDMLDAAEGAMRDTRHDAAAAAEYLTGEARRAVDIAREHRLAIDIAGAYLDKHGTMTTDDLRGICFEAGVWTTPPARPTMAERNSAEHSAAEQATRHSDGHPTDMP